MGKVGRGIRFISKDSLWKDCVYAWEWTAVFTIILCYNLEATGGGALGEVFQEFSGLLRKIHKHHGVKYMLRAQVSPMVILLYLYFSML